MAEGDRINNDSPCAPKCMELALHLMGQLHHLGADFRSVNGVGSDWIVEFAPQLGHVSRTGNPWIEASLTPAVGTHGQFDLMFDFGSGDYKSFPVRSEQDIDKVIGKSSEEFLERINQMKPKRMRLKAEKHPSLKLFSPDGEGHER